MGTPPAKSVGRIAIRHTQAPGAGWAPCQAAALGAAGARVDHVAMAGLAVPQGSIGVGDFGAVQAQG